MSIDTHRSEDLRLERLKTLLRADETKLSWHDLMPEPEVTLYLYRTRASLTRLRIEKILNPEGKNTRSKTRESRVSWRDLEDLVKTCLSQKNISQPELLTKVVKWFIGVEAQEYVQAIEINQESLSGGDLMANPLLMIMESPSPMEISREETEARKRVKTENKILLPKKSQEYKRSAENLWKRLEDLLKAQQEKWSASTAMDTQVMQQWKGEWLEIGQTLSAWADRQTKWLLSNLLIREISINIPDIILDPQISHIMKLRLIEAGALMHAYINGVQEIKPKSSTASGRIKAGEELTSSAIEPSLFFVSPAERPGELVKNKFDGSAKILFPSGPQEASEQSMSLLFPERPQNNTDPSATEDGIPQEIHLPRSGRKHIQALLDHHEKTMSMCNCAGAEVDNVTAAHPYSAAFTELSMILLNEGVLERQIIHVPEDIRKANLSDEDLTLKILNWAFKVAAYRNLSEEIAETPTSEEEKSEEYGMIFSNPVIIIPPAPKTKKTETTLLARPNNLASHGGILTTLDPHLRELKKMLKSHTHHDLKAIFTPLLQWADSAAELIFALSKNQLTHEFIHHAIATTGEKRGNRTLDMSHAAKNLYKKRESWREVFISEHHRACEEYFAEYKKKPSPDHPNVHA